MTAPTTAPSLSNGGVHPASTPASHSVGPLPPVGAEPATLGKRREATVSRRQPRQLLPCPQVEQLRSSLGTPELGLLTSCAPSPRTAAAGSCQPTHLSVRTQEEILFAPRSRAFSRSSFLPLIHAAYPPLPRAPRKPGPCHWSGGITSPF